MTMSRWSVSAARVARVGIPAAMLCLLVACGSTPEKDAPSPATTSQDTPRRSPYPPAKEDPGKRGNYTAGGLYAPGIEDSAPDVEIDTSLIPEPEVVAEPRSRYGNPETYTVLGKEYHVLDSAEGYVDTGIASYYGTKFHGRRTSSMEVYDMYAFTAAHKSLPLPSFARVTNLDNGKSVVVRVNDRGPFHEGRIIDLSYAAALKLGITRSGTAPVEVRALLPGDDAGDAMTVDAQDHAGKPDSGAASTAATATAVAAPSSLDTLVKSLPVSSAGVVNLPPGVRIATGRPTRLHGTDAATGATRAANATDADSSNWRFDMRQDGRVMSAEDFDTWMRSRGARIATGASAPVATPAAGNVGDAATMAASPATAPVRVASANVMPSGTDVTLQVASFASHDNAERALAIVREASIANARLRAAMVGGRQYWRLRIGPVARARVPGLSAQLARLGFDPPRILDGQ